MRPSQVRDVLEADIDFPNAAARSGFEPSALPVTRDYLRRQYLGPPFIDYMATWPKFVADA